MNALSIRERDEVDAGTVARRAVLASGFEAEVLVGSVHKPNSINTFNEVISQRNAKVARSDAHIVEENISVDHRLGRLAFNVDRSVYSVKAVARNVVRKQESTRLIAVESDYISAIEYRVVRDGDHVAACDLNKVP